MTAHLILLDVIIACFDMVSFMLHFCVYDCLYFLMWTRVLKQFISAQVVQQVLIFVCSARAGMVTTQWITAIMNNIEPPLNFKCKFF